MYFLAKKLNWKKVRRTTGEKIRNFKSKRIFRKNEIIFKLVVKSNAVNEIKWKKKSFKIGIKKL